MFCALKKTLGVCLIGLGLGILLVLLLPITRMVILFGNSHISLPAACGFHAKERSWKQNESCCKKSS